MGNISAKPSKLELQRRDVQKLEREKKDLESYKKKLDNLLRIKQKLLSGQKLTMNDESEFNLPRDILAGLYNTRRDRPLAGSIKVIDYQINTYRGFISSSQRDIAVLSSRIPTLTARRPPGRRPPTKKPTAQRRR